MVPTNLERVTVALAIGMLGIDDDCGSSDVVLWMHTERCTVEEV